MENEKLRVLIINDMVIFPNNEVRIEYDKNLVEKTFVEGEYFDSRPLYD